MQVTANSKIKTIGLTGGIASGKTAASDWFAEQGVHIVDADIVAREVVSKGSPLLIEIASYFQSTLNENVLLETGALNRSKLRNIIFSDVAHKQWLESKMHPIIRAEIEHQLDTQPDNYAHPYQVFVSPLLFETNQQSMCNGVLLISANKSTQLARLLKRDNCDETQAHAIMDAQMQLVEKQALATWQIENGSDLNALHQALSAFDNALRCDRD